MVKGVVVRCRNCGRVEKIRISNGPKTIIRFFYNEKIGEYKTITEKCNFSDEIIIKRERHFDENEKVLKLSRNFRELKTLKEVEVESHFLRCKTCKERNSFEIIKHIFE